MRPPRHRHCPLRRRHPHHRRSCRRDNNNFAAAATGRFTERNTNMTKKTNTDTHTKNTQTKKKNKTTTKKNKSHAHAHFTNVVHRRATPGRADLSIEDAFDLDFASMMVDFTQPASDMIEEHRAPMSPEALKAFKGFLLSAFGPHQPQPQPVTCFDCRGNDA